jgi:hypothetical protein
LSLSRYARPSLRLPFHQPKSTQLLPPAMPQPRWPCLSNGVASQGATLLFSLMAPCAVQRSRRSVRPKSAGRRMAACGWCTQLASATVEAVGYANSVSGMAATREIPHRVSVLLHPLQIGSAPLLWKDWSRRQHRRACMQLLRHQRVDVHLEPALQPGPTTSPPVLSHAKLAHSRLSWEERLAYNALTSTIGRCTITLFGVPEGFATSLGLLTV